MVSNNYLHHLYFINAKATKVLNIIYTYSEQHSKPFHDNDSIYHGLFNIQVSKEVKSLNFTCPIRAFDFKTWKYFLLTHNQLYYTT